MHSSFVVDVPGHEMQDTLGSVIYELTETYNTALPLDQLECAKNEVNQVKESMGQISSRGERDELLVDKTDSDSETAANVRRTKRSQSLVGRC